MADEVDHSNQIPAVPSGRVPGRATRPSRTLWKRILGWCAALVAVLILGFVILLELIVHRPSPAHPTLTQAEISAEDDYLKQNGLMVRDGSFLKEHPFEAPWTSHSLLAPSGWSHELPIKAILGSHRVRADLLLADLDVLQPVMERAYGGWESAAARGWNWDKWFADWRKVLAARGSAELTFDEAFAPVDVLLAFQRDNHTQIPLYHLAAPPGSQTALLAGVPSGACDQIRAGGHSFHIDQKDAGQRVRTARVWRSGDKTVADTSYISMPNSFGSPDAVHCGGTWIPLQPVGDRKSAGIAGLIMMEARSALNKTENQPRIERLGDGVVYVRLPTFQWSNYEGVSRTGWAQRQPGDRVLIVDLRNNGGGTWGYGLDVLSGWIDEKRMIPFESLGTEVNSSCLYTPLKWNYTMESMPRILPSYRPYLQGLLNRMSEPYPDGCPRSVESRPAQWSYVQRHFDAKPGAMRIIALVNSNCGSDCELMTTELASLPETVVAGVNTFGVGQFIQPGYSVLPHTGLRYRIALGKSNFYGDNRSYEDYGLDVDLLLPEVDTLWPQDLRPLAEVVARL